MGSRAFITPGIGVDPTNEYRDTEQKGIPVDRKSGARQGVAAQDLADRNLLKVSLDFYIQGFCLSSLTLRPSAFYGAANMRTRAIRAQIWQGAAAAAAASEPRGSAPCLRRAARDAKRSGDAPGLSECQTAGCGLRSCNPNQ